MKRSPLTRKTPLRARRAPRARSGIDYTLFDFGKEEPRPVAKWKAELAHRQARRRCRREVFRRDADSCRCCGKRLFLLARNASGWWDIAEVHEVIKRSAGGSDVDPVNCITLCHLCHAAVEGRRGPRWNLTLIVVDGILGANGPIEFQRRLKW